MAAEAEISRVVQLLGDLLIHKVNFMQGIEDDIICLRRELIKMQSFLTDANKKQRQDERVRNWISDIREVALDAEDAIDALILNSGNPRGSRRGLLQSCAVFPNHGIGKEMKSFHNRLINIDRTRGMYGLEPSRESGETPGKSEIEARWRLAWWEKHEDVVGLEDDVEKLLQPIMDEDNKGLWVTAVVGMRGIGKSTLAREVYNHPDIAFAGQFDCRAWVVIASEFTPQETIKQLILETARSQQTKQDMDIEIKKLVESTRDGLNLERMLKELLYRRLEGKTYFIVLDDVRNNAHWNSIVTAFPDEKDKTSRLLLTTTWHNVAAKHCRNLHEMMLLDMDKSWELFMKKGHPFYSYENLPELRKGIGRCIVKKCDGLPLAITTITGLLAETQSDREWEEAFHELNSYMGKGTSSISTILELSYQSLSPQLKYCFLCLAFFREDATIPVKRLVNIMVGQGLIYQTWQTKAMAENIARGYLDELINRNVVQVKDLTLDNRVKSCYIHDFFRHICLKKGKKELGLDILRGNRGSSLHKPRHRIVQCDDLRSVSLSQNKHIHSLFVLNVREDINEIKSSYWKSFQRLKILDLDCYYPLRRLPRSFRLLLGLKQLSIRRQPHKIFFNDFFNQSSRPLKLPTWLNTLKKLERLDLGIELVEFPDVALQIDSLRHIHAYCVRGPMIAGSCKNVETLKYIRQEDWMRSNLSSMHGCQVRELGIIMVDESSQVIALSLEKLENLVKLYLVWNYLLPTDEEINIPLLTNLTKLKLNGMMRKCPDASMLPPNLTHLTLENSFLDEDPMQELSKLPKLLYLKLKNHSYTGERMQVLRGGFTCLRGLHLRELFELRRVNIEEGGMPQLKVLQVRDCFALNTKNLSSRSYMLQILDTI